MKVGIFNELVYGCKWSPNTGTLDIRIDFTTSADMIEAKGSNRHPLGQLAYRIVSANISSHGPPRIVLSWYFHESSV